jgi:voltage-gated potassium channel
LPCTINTTPIQLSPGRATTYDPDPVAHTPDDTSPALSPVPASPTRLSAYRHSRRVVYGLLLSPEFETRAERLVRAFVSIIILANVSMVVLETVPSIEARLASFFRVFEIVSIAIFTIEYGLRVWAAVEDPRYIRPFFGRLRYMVSVFALIDLFAIVPFFLPHVFRCDLRFLRGLRLLRLIRVVKLGRHSDALDMYGQILLQKRAELAVSMALLALLLLMASSAMYFLEHEAQPHQFCSIPAAMWWGIVTLTTIGYGDIVPVTVGGRLFGSFIAVIGVGFVALPSAILVSGMMEQLELRKTRLAALTEPHDRACPHCGRLPTEPPVAELPTTPGVTPAGAVGS